MAARKTKSRRYRRLKRKSKGRGGCLIFLIILALLAAAAFYVYRWQRDEMSAQAGLFMEALAAGDAAQAALLATPETQEATGPLAGLFKQGTLFYEGIGEAKLTGLDSGQVTFNSRGAKGEHSWQMPLLRREGRWLVSGLPPVERFEGAFVRSEQGGRLQLLWQREERELLLDRPMGLGFGMVVSLCAVGGVVVEGAALEQQPLSRLLRLAPEAIDGQMEGPFPIGRPPLVYLVDGLEAREGSLNELVIGREGIDLFLDGGQVVAAKLRGGFSPQAIRVVLNDSSYRSLEHQLLRLSGGATFFLEAARSGQLHTFDPGSVLAVEPAEAGLRVSRPGGGPLLFDERITFRPQAGSKLAIHNLARPGWGRTAPVYRGVIEVSNIGGKLVVVNELPLEQYLYSVVSSEMPVRFGEEPLKAQAVVARSYAYASMLSGGYRAYGAHLDDSVLSQVYNNAPEQPAAVAAVEATAGLAVFHGGAVADTRYFSTSPGYTANMHEVWQDPRDGSFPATPVPYLAARPQLIGETVSLESEEQVRAFLERGDWASYDSGSPYFRWRIEMRRDELEASINSNLGPRWQAQPDFVLTGQGGRFRSLEIASGGVPLGELLDLRVIRRGEGGNIMELEIEGSGGVFRVLKEYNIRAVLRPAQFLAGRGAIYLSRHDGSRLSMDRDALLPSAFVFFDLVRGEGGRLEKVVMIGGGFGHAVGMSQHGARGMAEQGRSFEEIIAHYYPGTSLEDIYVTSVTRGRGT